jgi:hypothetical protein
MRARTAIFAVVVAALSSLAVSAASAAILVIVDKSRQQMTVEVDGETRWVWPVSTGKGGYDTPSGKFRAFRMEKDHFSKEWDEAPMPNSIFFTAIGHAIHGSYDVRRLGTPASHGCVRLAPENAAKLFALVQETGVLKTTVVLTGIAPAGNLPAVARRNQSVDPYDDGGFAAQQQYGAQYGSQYGSRDERRYGSIYSEPLPIQPGYQSGSVYSSRRPVYSEPVPPPPQYREPRGSMFPFNMN